MNHLNFLKTHNLIPAPGVDYFMRLANSLNSYKNQETGLSYAPKFTGTTWTTEQAIPEASLMAQRARDAAKRAMDGLPPVHSPVDIAGLTTDAAQPVDVPALSPEKLYDSMIHSEEKGAFARDMQMEFLTAKEQLGGRSDILSEEQYTNLIGLVRPHGTGLDASQLNWMRLNNVVPAPGEYVNSGNFEQIQLDVTGQIDGYTGYTWTIEQAIKSVEQSASVAENVAKEAYHVALTRVWADASPNIDDTDQMAVDPIQMAADAVNRGADVGANTVQMGLNSATDATEMGVNIAADAVQTGLNNAANAA